MERYEERMFENNAERILTWLQHGQGKLVFLSDVFVDGNGTQKPFDIDRVRAGTLLAMRSCIAPFLKNEALRLWVANNSDKCLAVTSYKGGVCQHGDMETYTVFATAASV